MIRKIVIARYLQDGPRELPTKLDRRWLADFVIRLLKGASKRKTHQDQSKVSPAWVRPDSLPKVTQARPRSTPSELLVLPNVLSPDWQHATSRKVLSTV